MTETRVHETGSTPLSNLTLDFGSAIHTRFQESQNQRSSAAIEPEFRPTPALLAHAAHAVAAVANNNFSADAAHGALEDVEAILLASVFEAMETPSTGH